MTLKANELLPAPGATHAKKRLGRGNGSGHGTYAGRGLKGQKARSGKKLAYDAFEGGQFPTSRRFHVLRGFNNKWRTAYQPVNLEVLNRFADGTEVTPELLKAVGVVRSLQLPVKVLGEGHLTRKLTVRVPRASAAARAKIEAAGGTVVTADPEGTDA